MVTPIAASSMVLVEDIGAQRPPTQHETLQERSQKHLENTSLQSIYEFHMYYMLCVLDLLHAFYHH